MPEETTLPQLDRGIYHVIKDGKSLVTISEEYFNYLKGFEFWVNCLEECGIEDWEDYTRAAELYVYYRT